MSKSAAEQHLRKGHMRQASEPVWGRAVLTRVIVSAVATILRFQPLAATQGIMICISVGCHWRGRLRLDHHLQQCPSGLSHQQQQQAEPCREAVNGWLL